jgi:Tfp pilus assembly protein PilX
MRKKTIKTKQKGVALVTALVLLVALTLVALSGIQSTSVQLQISGNDEATVEAYEYAQSVVDAVIENSTNFVVGADIGYTTCLNAGPGCNATSINLTETMFSGVNLQAKVELLKIGQSPRLVNGNSMSQTNGAYFSIEGQYDETANNRGKSGVVQGYVMIIPTGQ